MSLHNRITVLEGPTKESDFPLYLRPTGTSRDRKHFVEPETPTFDSRSSLIYSYNRTNDQVLTEPSIPSFPYPLHSRHLSVFKSLVSLHDCSRGPLSSWHVEGLRRETFGEQNVKKVVIHYIKTIDVLRYKVRRPLLLFYPKAQFTDPSLRTSWTRLEDSEVSSVI